MTAHSRKIKRALALALTLAAAGPAAALARPLPADPPGWPATTPAQASQRYLLQGTHDVGSTTQPSGQIVEVSPSGGFDWGDAGIGAAGAVGVTMLAMGGVAITRRHGHGPTSAPS